MDEVRKAQRKLSLRMYFQSPAGKAAIYRYNNSAKARATRRKYKQSPKGREKNRLYLEWYHATEHGRRMRVLENVRRRHV